MKKIIVLLITAALLILCVGCGKEQSNGKITQSGEVTAVQQNFQEAGEVYETNSDDVAEDALLSATYNVPLEKIFIDVPDYKYIEEGYTSIFKDGDTKYVAFTCALDDSVKTSDEALDLIFPKFKDNVDGHDIVNELGKLDKSNIEINGISTLNFKGTINVGSDPEYNAYFYGYSFVFEEKPCAIFGVVKDINQPQEAIDEVTEVVDAMMLSVRNEP